jgi:hypothetical protein
MEIAMLSGEVRTSDLPDLWNTRMQEYLGVVPDSDAKGPIVLGTMNGRQGFIRIGPGRPSRPDPHQNKTRNLSPM